METEHDIATTSRLSGIPKDLLRMWERRYDFPHPRRNPQGQRVYSERQLDKLRLIRQLLDRGQRPGRLVGMEVDELRGLLDATPGRFDAGALQALLRGHDSQSLQAWIRQGIDTLGLRTFVCEVMPPALEWVGEHWARGELPIHAEHLLSESLQRSLRSVLDNFTPRPGAARIMLTTVPGERHALGLLMVEALLRQAGAEVVAFGTEMPFQEIRAAAETYAVDVVALSFSRCLGGEDAMVMLSGLRGLLDPSIALWAGGAGVADLPLRPEGVEILDSLPAVERALAKREGPGFASRSSPGPRR